MVTLAIRFAAELFGVAAAAVVGASVPAGQPWPLVLGVAAPAALVVFWALVAAPKANNSLAPRTRELVGTVALLVVAALLGGVGQPVLASAFAAVVVVDQGLILALDPRPTLEQPLGVARH